MKRIAIFASGGGSNAEKIIQHLADQSGMEVSLILCNRKEAGVFQIAERFNIKSVLISRSKLNESEKILAFLRENGIDFIVLAGFLLLIPQYLVEAYPERIVNIHPALLPKFGGKGMYGMNVHRAVKSAGEKISGPTIHFVNEHYDKGNFIFQATCSISPEDSPENIAKKVLQLEHQYFPKIVSALVADLPS